MNNMETGIASIILSVAGALILILLGVNGFWLKKFVEEVENLSKLVSEIQLLVGNEKARTDAFWHSCERTHGVVDLRLNEHSKKLTDHGLMLEKHSTEIENLKRR